jgi:para-nitrobenzyl esterase
MVPLNWGVNLAHSLVGRVGTPVSASLSTGDTVQGRIAAIMTSDLPERGPSTVVAAFKGIPYAQPPVGDLRWRAPMPLAKLPRNPYPATSFGPACPQQQTLGQRLSSKGSSSPEVPLDARIGSSGTSEDCLYMNVWTPSLESKDRLPVLVWIHGGGFVRGTAAAEHTDGARLASHGAVVVSFDYRLGPLGFFHHGAFDGDPDPKVNFGLLDQIQALRWLKANIASFGGDPNRIAIFGSSAGGASVQWLTLSPRVKDERLFQGAISQSGGGLGEKLPAFSRGSNKGETAQSLGETFFRSLDRDQACVNSARRNDLAGLKLGQVESRHGPATALRHCVSLEQLEGFFGTRWNADKGVARSELRNYPFVDGTTVAYSSAAEGFAKGAQMDVPMIFGYSTYELSVAIGLGQKPDREWISKMVKEQNIAQQPSMDDLKRSYGDPPESDLVADLYRDIVYGIPAQILATLHAQKKKSPTYVYRYGYVSARKRNARPNKAPHSSEAISIFGNFPRADKKPMAKLPSQVLNDIEISEIMMGYWINMAGLGDPNGRGAGGGSRNRPGLPLWPAYDPQKNNILAIENGDARDGGKVVKTVTGSSDLMKKMLQRWEGSSQPGN